MTEMRPRDCVPHFTNGYCVLAIPDLGVDRATPTAPGEQVREPSGGWTHTIYVAEPGTPVAEVVMGEPIRAGLASLTEAIKIARSLPNPNGEDPEATPEKESKPQKSKRGKPDRPAGA